jgi:DNA-binding CsgD family transcriptional regulator/tetratricopeptide (TPR) repeat protein
VAARGQGGVVVVEGPAGSGKTRLCHDAAEVATIARLDVARASCEAEQPGGAFHAICSCLGLATAAQGAGPDGRASVVDDACMVIEKRAQRAPLLVFLDDLQWADRTSMLLLRRLVARLSAYPVLWLFATCFGEAEVLPGRVLAALNILDRATEIVLHPLSSRAVAQLVADVTGAPPDSELLSWGVDTGGYPGAVLELAEALCDEGAIEVAHGRSRLTGTDGARSVETVFARRLVTLSAESRRVVEVAAVLGRSFRMADLASAMGTPAACLVTPVREATAAGLFASGGPEALSFRRELVREAVYRGLEDPIRLALHRQIGELLLARGGAATRAAVHLIQGAERGDHKVLDGLDRAIVETRRSCPESAADLARRALELTDPADPTRPARTALVVEVLVGAKRLEQAEQLARSTLALAGIPTVVAAQLRLALSSVLFIDGRTAEAIAEMEVTLEVTDLPDQLYAAAEVTRLMCLLARGDLSRARAGAVAILAGRGRPDCPCALAGALAVLAYISWWEGRVEDALGLARAAIRRADSGGVIGLRVQPRLLLAGMLTGVGDFDAAEAALAACSEEIELEGDGLWAAAPTIAWSALDLARGRLGEAFGAAEVGLALTEEVGIRPLSRWARRVLASVALDRGDFKEAASHLERQSPPPSPACAAAGVEDLFVHVRLVEARDGAACCVDQFRWLYDDLTALKHLALREPDSAPSLARAALAAGDRRRAERVAACVEQLAADNSTLASLGARAGHARALLDGDLAGLQRAATEHRHPRCGASACEDAGVVLVHAGRSAEARDCFERALALYRDAGANRDTARVRARLRRVGVRRRHWANSERPVSGWGSLTGTERTVAGLVAEGLTNPQVAARMFVSRHTVDFHLRQIFRKLQVASRVELTRQVVEAAQLA